MSAAVLPFPKYGGRKRRAEGMGAAGLLSLLLLEREGESIPANVERIDKPQEALTRSPELLLALAVFGSLPKRQRDRVQSTIRCLAYGANRNPDAVMLNDALNGRLA